MTELSLQVIEAFVEVAQRGSVTEAARALGRSQPAVSHRIKQLEEQLGVALFERQGRGLRLTPRGSLLLREAEGVLARLRTLPDVLLRDEVEPMGQVTIGALPTVARYYLIDALHEALKEMPQVKWVVEVGLSEALLDKLRQGRVDVVYGIGALAGEGFEVEELGDVSACVAYAPTLWPHEQPPSLEALRGMRLLLWRGLSDLSFELLEAHARSLGLISHETVEVPHIETLRELATRGAGYTLLPDYVVRGDVWRGELRTTALLGFDRRFVVRRYLVPERHQSLALRRFLSLVAHSPLPSSVAAS